jgi:hypothetical protein
VASHGIAAPTHLVAMSRRVAALGAASPAAILRTATCTNTAACTNTDACSAGSPGNPERTPQLGISDGRTRGR